MSTQHHLSGGTYRERLGELGLPAWRGEGNREMPPLGGSETTEPNPSQTGAEALTWERNSCQALPRANKPSCRQLWAGAGRGTVGRDGGWYSDGPAAALGGETGCRLPGLRWLSVQIWHSSCVAWWACSGLGPDFSCGRFGNEVKIRLNLYKKWEVSGEVFCCLILRKQGGNCTPSSCCEIAAMDNQKWDRFFFFFLLELWGAWNADIYSFSPDSCL